jgi:ABC-type phosphate transport system substrate-binding protein
MKHRPLSHTTGALFILAVTLAAPMDAYALKYAAQEHQLTVDPATPGWTPGKLNIEPEEEFNLVGADIMDEITLGWVKLFRKAYPQLSVTMEARASGTGVNFYPSKKRRSLISTATSPRHFEWQPAVLGLWARPPPR